MWTRSGCGACVVCVWTRSGCGACVVCVDQVRLWGLCSVCVWTRSGCGACSVCVCVDQVRLWGLCSVCVWTRSGCGACIVCVWLDQVGLWGLCSVCVVGPGHVVGPDTAAFPCCARQHNHTLQTGGTAACLRLRTRRYCPHLASYLSLYTSYCSTIVGAASRGGVHRTRRRRPAGSEGV